MPSLLVIAGPTASGKTDLAIEIAEKRGAEIISADSQQVYRRFDIGTAKPTSEQLAQVRHHLISVLEPDASFSAAAYAKQADEAIRDIHGRGREVVVVGGTGLYIRALLHGVLAAPPVDPLLRGALEGEVAERGTLVLHARLAAADPQSAAQIATGDARRIVRALELLEQTGIAPSQLRAQHGFRAERYSYSLFVLSPPQESLHAAIAARTEAIFAAGLLSETKRLLDEGLGGCPVMSSVGYRQAREVVEGRMSEAEARMTVTRETRRYAKRQLTWFRREQGAQWIHPPYAELRGDPLQ